MVQQEIELLLKDLCARLSYGVKIHIESCGEIWDDILDSISIGKAGSTPMTYINRTVILENCICKPYLRPMSSMTEEERKEYEKFSHFSIGLAPILMDWIYSHHLDCCGLIEKGLAIEAPEGMYE